MAESDRQLSGRAHLACLSARPFSKEAKEFIASSMGLPLTVVSDGLYLRESAAAPRCRCKAGSTACTMAAVFSGSPRKPARSSATA